MERLAVKPQVQPRAAKAEARTGLLQRKCACGAGAGVSGACEECQNKRTLQTFRRGSGPQIDVIPAAVHSVLRGPGRPLDGATRSLMEPGFGHDFSQVRVHAGPAAAESARAINALAYTVGRDVVFANRQYAPSTAAGKRLLAHELAHVVQQERATATGTPLLAGLRWEREADAAADAVLSGGRASVVGRTDRPMLARYSETRTMTETDSAEVSVDRIIHPGKCVSEPRTRTSSAADATGKQAFLEFDVCKGRTGATARGEVNYGAAIDKARSAAANLAQNLASQQPDQAFQTFRDELGQVAPDAKVEFSFQRPGLRVGTTGTGKVSDAGGASGKATLTGAVDLKSLTFRVEYQVEAGTGQQTNQQVLVTVGTRDRSKQDRNCFVCICSDPEIFFQCRRKPPPGKKEPPAAPLAPVIVPLFFDFEKTEPRADWKAQYEKALQLAVQQIREGYTITRIEGDASPEGPEQPRRKGGFNNVDLAQQRADEARDDLRTAIRATRTGFGFRGLKSLGDALAASYPVEGKGELFGRDGGKEVSEREQFRHLEKELKAPSEGEPDKLAAAHVTGAGLPPDIGAEVGEQVKEFRTGMRGEKRLSRPERLETMYRPLRRALIFLDPPPQRKPRLLTGNDITPDSADRLLGKEIDCTPAHMNLFAAVLPPKSEMFQGECTDPGAKTVDPGQSKP